MRFERKYRTESSHADVIQKLKLHPAVFTEAFHIRRINNIYFDTPGFDCYYDNIEGSRNRWKYRIRWYGETFQYVKDPVLEIKVKKGLLGFKHHFPLRPFNIGPGFSIKDIDLTIDTKDKDASFVNILGKNLTPVLLNTYERRYFISADHKFRITVDFNQEFYRINRYNNLFLNHFKIENNNALIELKYENEDELLAKEVGKSINFLLTKNSKYIEGIEKTSF